MSVSKASVHIQLLSHALLIGEGDETIIEENIIHISKHDRNSDFKNTSCGNVFSYFDTLIIKKKKKSGI